MPRRRHFSIAAVLLGLLFSCAPARTVGVRPQPKLGEPSRISPQARELLAARMERHGDTMMWLMATVVLLKHEPVHELAQEIALEPKISRPAAGDQDTVNAALPPRFFELQDELQKRAAALAQAAAARDDAAMGAA